MKIRIPEKKEIITGKEARLYANRKDDRSLNYSMVAFDIIERTKLNNDQKILEVACGAGQLAYYLYLFTKSNNIIATDGSKELISFAQEKFKGVPIKFFVANIYNHPWKEMNDIVICKDAFHHLKKPIEGIKKLFNLVSYGGILYIYDLARDAPRRQIEKRLNTFDNEHEKKRFLQSLNASFTLKEMKEILKKAMIKKYKYFYPSQFSKENISYHEEWIKKDKVKEHKLSKLSRIFLIYKL
ncbi:MAG: class I SAM-dependent methyltransferase [candidate division WOR-3 bacterium]